MTSRRKKFLWASGICLLVGGLGAAWWFWHFRTYTPAAVAMDIRAAISVRNDPYPAERFLEARYGPLTEPANRQKAFLEFFEYGHMEGMYMITKHMRGRQKETNILGMAKWVATYRETMSPAEKESLQTYLNSKAGRNKLAAATSHYLKKEVEYRAATEPVIRELMTTLATLDEQPGKQP